MNIIKKIFKKKKRLGRGNSSKKGNTCCRGNKGQKSRSGYSKKPFFSGGQTRINIACPKIGFKGKKKKKSILIKKNENNIVFLYRKKKHINYKSLKFNIFLYNCCAGKNIKKKILFSGGNIK
ncbi:hypothetical protein ACWNX6_00795 [Candidatus Vidania fulgoroideorum]